MGTYEYALRNTKLKKRFNLTEAEIEKIGLTQNGKQTQYNPSLETAADFELSEEELTHIKGAIEAELKARPEGVTEHAAEFYSTILVN
jgi:hypothetical protein